MVSLHSSECREPQARKDGGASALDRGKGREGAAPGLALFALRAQRRPCFFSSRVLRSLEASEGLAPFRSRTIGRVSVRPWRPRSLVSAKREPRPKRAIPGSQARGPRTRGKRQADRSDARQEYARVKSPNRFRKLPADGRQPFMPQDYLTTPAFNLIPSVSPITRRMRPLSVGRAENALHPATDL
jgi:hypothetical protein